MNEYQSPFGGNAERISSLSVTHICDMYFRKCNVDVSRCFDGLAEVGLYECPNTGYRFWRPGEIAGSEALYVELSRAWKDYYRRSRWEYGPAKRYVHASSRVLEVGCGRGFFLKTLEGRVSEGLGVEPNRDAVASKTTSFEITSEMVSNVAARRPGTFDCVFSFQVLEHLFDPSAFIDDCLACLRPGGMLLLSTPNNSYLPHSRQEDAFDLPPHHMGHFTPSVYRRIAQLKRLPIVALEEQPRIFAAQAVTATTERKILFRSIRWLTGHVMNAAYRLFSEPGPHLLAVLSKPK